MRNATLTIFSSLALIASASVTAQQLARPAAPVVTAGANIKELTFDWDPVPGAYTYWVMEKKDARSSFTPIGVRITGGRTRAAAPVAVHLQNWAESRYAIAACNTAGCTRSAPINPQPLRPETIGYFKASNTDAGDFFGASVVLSLDGSTLAVGAPNEASNATGVNGNQADNSAPSGAVYVYRRDGRRWKQEAYLKGSLNKLNQSFGRSDGYDQKAIAVSGNGSWVAVGAPGETVDGTRFAGGVYLFRRASNGTWSLHSTLRATESFPGQLGNSFGYSVEITEDGGTLKVNSSLPRGEDDAYEGRTHIYDFNGTTWQRTATLGPAFPGYYCSFVRMSGDGTTLTSMCFLFPSQQYRLTTRKRSGNAWVLVGDQEPEPTGVGVDLVTALSFDGTSIALREGSEPEARTLAIYRWEGSSWTRESEIPPPPGGIWHDWGYRTEFSRNARRVVVGSRGRSAVVYERIGNANDPWRQVPIGEGLSAGSAISLSGSGYYLAVGSPGDASNATGIDGDRNNASAENAGAVWLY